MSSAPLILDESAASAGLSTAEAAARLRRDGPNVMPRPPQPGVLALLGQQARDPLVLVLLGCAVITVAIGDVKDAVVIGLVLLGNTALSVRQSLKATSAIASLEGLLAATANVVRDGVVRSVPAEQVVVGDLLEVAAGDVVPADAALVDAHGLQVDESMLTGEAVPVPKAPGAMLAQGDQAADEATLTPADQLFAGTGVRSGRGRAVVTAIGSATRAGRLSGLVTSVRAPVTPLQRRLAHLGFVIAVIVGVACLAVLGLNLATGEGVVPALVTAVSLAVAAVPESLPAVVAFALALGAQRMARRQAVVRSLPAVETLGAVTLIASDKTGTLTQGRLRLTAWWSPSSPAPHLDDGAIDTDLMTALLLCREPSIVPDPLDEELELGAQRAGLDPDRLCEAWQLQDHTPFDFRLRRVRTVHTGPEGQRWELLKGAPEAVLPELPKVPASVTSAVERLTGEGLRVIAVVGRLDEGDFEVLGLVGFDDPVRPEAASAVAACTRAGVRLALVTGDHPRTAQAVARRLGLDRGDGQHVYARVAPEDKVGLVIGWQREGQVVAMTGDGVNDAPALRRADVGVAMGRGGTQVAKDAADLVLLDDDLATVVAAVEEGRRVYANIRHFLLYAVAGGFSELVVMLVGPLLGLGVVLLPTQILWINLLTHGLVGVSLAAEPAEPGVLDREPRDPEESILGGGLWQRAMLLAGVIASTVLVLALVGKGFGWPVQTVAFLALGLGQLLSALGLRSEDRPLTRIPLMSNPLLVWCLSVAVVLQVVAAVTVLGVALDLDRLSLGPAAVVTAVASTGLVAVELGKLRSRRQAQRGQQGPSTRDVVL